MPLVSESVQLTHLRTSVTSDVSLALEEGSDEPGDAMPGEGKGKQVESSMDRLSMLIANLNEVFGKDLGEPDMIWIDQGRAAIEEDEEMRAIAKENDKAQFIVTFGAKAKDMIVERHEANGMLFDAFFDNPQFQRLLLNYWAETYEALRAGA